MSFPWAKQYQPTSEVGKWMDERLPLARFVHGALGPGYPTPKNLNAFYNFGVLAGVALVIQIITGVVLAMHFAADTRVAFDSVEHIMRDVNGGWMIRYMHAVGASFFFGVVYIHIFRGLYYGSYKPPREVLWMLGLVIFLLMMATAFMGYVLVWGQMSFWGATVITGLFSAFPVVGTYIQTLLLGGFSPDNATLNRFFSLHYLLPFVTFGVIILHVWALHIPGSNNPTGVDVKSEADTVPFHPYYTAKDFVGLGIYLILFAAFVFFMPNSLGEPDNYILDACPHLAGMVFLALLRHPACLHDRLPGRAGQAVGRARDVRFDLAAVPAALARYIAGALEQLSSAQPPAVLGVRGGGCGAGRVRRQAGGRTLGALVPGPHRLLFRPFPDHPADRLQAGEN